MAGGRPRKPTAVKVAEGNRGKRKLTPDPEFTKGAGDPPKHLRGIARTKFMELSEALDALGLIERPDAAALEGACIAYERAVKADNILRQQGITIKAVNAQGKPYYGQHPAVNISKVAWEQYRKFCTEFGLTPASRSRLGAAKDAPVKDSLASVLDSAAELPDVEGLGAIQ